MRWCWRGWRGCKMNAALLSSVKTTWGTPINFFEKVQAEHQLTLDVCALPNNAKLPRFFTPEMDGLSQDWGTERCWMNPPYGREITKWMLKAWESSLKGAYVVCLVPARTDTAWWHDYATKGIITFLRGRLRFEGAKHPAPFPCALVVFKPSVSTQADGGMTL